MFKSLYVPFDNSPHALTGIELARSIGATITASLVDAAALHDRRLPSHHVPAWADDAAAMLDRIPSFVRARVRERIEAKARAAGHRVITLGFMRANRPPIPFGGDQAHAR